MKRPISDTAELPPPKKKQKKQNRAKICLQGKRDDDEEIFKGTVVKKLDCICFVSPETKAKGDVLLRADCFADEVFDTSVVKGTQVHYWKVSSKRGKSRAQGAEVIKGEDGLPLVTEVNEPESQKVCREGERNEDEQTYTGKVVKVLPTKCFVSPDSGESDVLLRADCFAPGVFDDKVKNRIRVRYWDMSKHYGKVRANGAEVCEGEPTIPDEKFKGTVVKKLNRLCFVKPDVDGPDVMIPADGFDEGMFDGLLVVNHRVSYWSVHTTHNGKTRANNADILLEEDAPTETVKDEKTQAEA